MKKKFIGLLVCMLLIATVVPTVISLENSTINPMIPSTSLSSMAADWTQLQKLLASDGEASDQFGLTVALDGDTALIGAPKDADNGQYSGSAYVFTRTDTTWTLQQKLLASDGEAHDYFGYSVSLSGDTALIGAIGVDSFIGEAYVFIRSGTTWTQQAQLLASDGAVYDQFGCSVSLHEDTALVGSYGHDSNEGSAYVFIRTGTTWTPQAQLLASDGAENDQFGLTVALDGDTALIGAHWEDDNVVYDTGAAYVFTRTGATWSQQQKLLASDGAAYDEFGLSVSLDGDTALIGAPKNDAASIPGSAYVFIRSGATWAQQDKLVASDGAAPDYFGCSVSVDEDTALIGAFWGDGIATDSGSAYVFIRSGITWTQQDKLVASDGEGYEEFGYSVSLHEDTALIGAFGDDSAKGSAYVFTRGSVNQPPVAEFTWTPQNPIQSQVITFDASNSYDPDGTITVYEWDWNNDGISDENHTTPTATHVWPEPDTYQVTLKVTDDQGAANTITKTINVSGMTLNIDIKGGFGVKVVITNNGTSDANDIPWQVHVEGGILGRINITVNGSIFKLPAGGTVSVGKLLLFGFGPITITVKVADEEKTTSGFLFLFFVIGVK
jgi:hypothetical protein